MDKRKLGAVATWGTILLD